MSWSLLTDGNSGEVRNALLRALDGANAQKCLWGVLGVNWAVNEGGQGPSSDPQVSVEMQVGGVPIGQSTYVIEDDWEENLDVYQGTFPNYTAPSFSMTKSAKYNSEVFQAVRDSEWEPTDEDYMVGIFLPMIVFVILLVIQTFAIPCGACAYRKLPTHPTEDANLLSTEGAAEEEEAEAEASPSQASLGTSGGRQGKASQGRLHPEWNRSESGHRRIIWTGFFFALIMACLAVSFGVRGSRGVKDGLEELGDTVCRLGGVLDVSSDLLDTVSVRFYGLARTGQTLINNAAECPGATGEYFTPQIGQAVFNASAIVNATVAAFAEPIEELVTDVYELGESLYIASSASSTAFVGYTCGILVLFIIFGLGSLVYYSENAGCMKVALGKCCNGTMFSLAYFILLVLWITAGLSFSGAAFSGDFCKDPTQHLWDMSRNWDETVQVNEYLQYYTTCQGSTRFHDLLLATKGVYRASLQALVPALDWVQTQQGNQTFADGGQSCLDTLDASYEVEKTLIVLWEMLGAVSAITSCAVVHEVYTDVFYKALCEDLSKSFRTIRVSYLCGAIAMSLVLLFYALSRRFQSMVRERRRSSSTQGSEEVQGAASDAKLTAAYKHSE